MQNVITAPKVGQSVFIPFVTKLDELTGKAEKIMGAALAPWDIIDAVYSETERSKSGKPIFTVRAKSGDVVKVMQKDDKWQAIA